MSGPAGILQPTNRNALAGKTAAGRETTSVRWHHQGPSTSHSPYEQVDDTRASQVASRRYRQLDSLRNKFNRLVYREPRYATPVSPPAFLPAEDYVAPQHLPWSTQLEAQLHAVCQEVGLTKAGAGAVIKAAHARRIPSNPGVMLAQVVELLTLEGEVASRGDLLAMVATYPPVLNCSARSITALYHSMAEVIPQAQLRKVLRSIPSMLTCTPFHLWSNLHALGTLLNMPAGRVGNVLVKAPRLLTTSPALLRQRFDTLQHFFDLSEEEARALVKRQPLLLASQSEKLASNAELLLAKLQLPAHLVVRMITKQPNLLLSKGQSLEDKLEQMCELLCLDTAALALVLIKQPSLLNFTLPSMAAKLQHLDSLLGLENKQVLNVARTCPALLTLASGSIAHKWGMLLQWAAGDAAWAEQLAAATPATKGLYLCFSARRLARLRYVAHRGMAQQWGVHRLLMMSQREALQVFPGMETWLQAQERLEQQARM